MGNSALLWSLIIVISSTLLLVGCALGAFLAASRSTPRRKQQGSPPPMSDFEIRFAKVEAEQAELFSTLQKLTTTLRRLSSRAGMEDLRERRSNDPPPIGTPKAQLREHYKLTGLSSQQIAQRQMFEARAKE